MQWSPEGTVSQSLLGQMSHLYISWIFSVKLFMSNLKPSTEILFQLKLRTELFIFHMEAKDSIQPRGVGLSERGGGA